ncbi:ribonuclease E/G, partial [candidate division KSB1 bacterium]
TRIAMVEDGKLVELFVEHPENERMMGDIYKGLVENIVPGMEAAFINIGYEQNAFLHFSDVGVLYKGIIEVESDEEDTSKSKSVLDKLKIGEDIIVQITKEPIGNKGARITTELSLPGRFLVLVPNANNIGVSKKIESYNEKKRLKNIAREIKPEGFGLIIRTVAEGKDEQLLKKDLNGLLNTWQKIHKRAKKEKAPVLLNKDLGMASSVIRDLFTKDINKVYIDSRRLHRNILSYIKIAQPQLKPAIELYKNQMPIFDYFNIESDIEKSYDRKIWIRGGGYIVIDHTEALTSIDVNSGKFIGRKKHEENSLMVNLESAREIARQLRIRDIGGLIVIDFIDLDMEKNRKRVYDELKKELKKDRARTSVLEISQFGLIEMTRQRIRPSLLFTISDPCPYCEGTGRVVSKETMVTKIEQWIKRFKLASKEKRLILTLHPDMADFLVSGNRNIFLKLMFKYWIKIDLEEKDTLKIDDFRFFSKKRNADITKEFMR